MSATHERNWILVIAVLGAVISTTTVMLGVGKITGQYQERIANQETVIAKHEILITANEVACRANEQAIMKVSNVMAIQANDVKHLEERIDTRLKGQSMLLGKYQTKILALLTGTPQPDEPQCP